ncbi:MAG: heat-shock protein [Alphaproteobacteria bacterium]|nr:MAG: heat-shock protein [Alphaproteobacteria bacterium]
MRSLDLSPLFRATIGFDQLADMFDRIMATDVGQSGYPPYNIEKTAEDAYRISVAVAGFSEDELNVEVKDNELVISGRKKEDDEKRTYLHRGIATRAFEKHFQLADHVHVTGATLRDGMLHVDLIREVPEALKPRRIEINSGTSIEGTIIDAKRIEGKESKSEKADEGR